MVEEAAEEIGDGVFTDVGRDEADAEAAVGIGGVAMRHGDDAAGKAGDVFPVLGAHLFRGEAGVVVEVAEEVADGGDVGGVEFDGAGVGVDGLGDLAEF